MASLAQFAADLEQAWSTWNAVASESAARSALAALNRGWAVGEQEADLTPRDPDPRALEFARRHNVAGVRRVGVETRNQIREQVERGLREGINQRGIRKKIAEVFSGEKWRVPVIARTESHRAANHGRWVAWKQSSVVRGKEWITAGDDRVRPSHAAVDGERAPLNDTFSLGVQMPPGGPNCRCTAGPVTDLTPDLFQARRRIPGLSREVGRYRSELLEAFDEFERRVTQAADGLGAMPNRARQGVVA